MGDWEGIDWRVETCYFHVYYLEIFVPDYHQRWGVLPETDLRVTSLLYVYSVFIFVIDHGHIEQGVDLAQSDQLVAGGSEEGAFVFVLVEGIENAEV